jgi:sensor c-di-GMP phosphodiesterase-like protein
MAAFITPALSELGITIVTWASTLPLQKTWHRQALIWLPAGILIGLLTAAFIAYFAPLTVAPSPVAGRYPASGHQSPLSTNYLAQNGKVVGAEALARWRRLTGAICHLKFSSRWRMKPG